MKSLLNSTNWLFWNIFYDVNKKLGDLCGYIEVLAGRGIVTTVRSYYRPYDTVTRAEMIKMVMWSIGIETYTRYLDVTPQQLGDLYGYILQAEKKWCLNSTFPSNTLEPHKSALRGEVFQVGLCSVSGDIQSNSFLLQKFRNEDLGVSFLYPQSFIDFTNTPIDIHTIVNSDSISIVWSNGIMYTLIIKKLPPHQTLENYITLNHWSFASSQLRRVNLGDGYERFDFWPMNLDTGFPESGVYNSEVHKIAIFPTEHECTFEDDNNNCITEQIIQTLKLH